MGFTMYLQQKLNPQPPDPIQAKVMMFLPVMFIFLFATFSAGLVIYWTWNNVLSIAQQWVIMRKMGVHADGSGEAIGGWEDLALCEVRREPGEVHGRLPIRKLGIGSTVASREL